MPKVSLIKRIPELESEFWKYMTGAYKTNDEIAEALTAKLHELGRTDLSVHRNQVQRHKKDIKTQQAIIAMREQQERLVLSEFKEVFANPTDTTRLDITGAILDSSISRLAIEFDANANDNDEDANAFYEKLERLQKLHTGSLKNKALTDGIKRNAKKERDIELLEAAKKEVDSGAESEQSIDFLRNLIAKTNAATVKPT